MPYIINPKTGKEIKVGGPTYQKLILSPKWGPMLAEAVEISPKKAAKKSKNVKAGCSNKGKYPNVAAQDFCGPAGGSCPGTFPVNTRGRARAALAYKRFAPDPEGIEECVYRAAKRKGWLSKSGKLRSSFESSARDFKM
jgi:hypothetical protein